MTILDDILASREVSFEAQRASIVPGPRPARASRLVDVLARGSSGCPRVIAEIKRASPSKGTFPAFDAVERAKLYEAGGAAAISVITEPRYFSGSFDDLRDVVQATSLPVVCKDFIVTRGQLELAASLGARATLVIARVPRSLALIGDCLELGMDPLVEIHDEVDLDAVVQAIKDHPACRIIGVNSRDLSTMAVDLSRVERLAPRVRYLLDNEPVIVAESGVRTVKDVARVARAGVDGVLIGTALASSPPGELQATVRRLSTMEE